MSDDPYRALGHLDTALAELSVGVDLIDESAALEVLAHYGRALDLVAAAAKDARAALTPSLYALMGEETVDVAGLRLTARGGRTNSQWASTELFRHLFGDQVINGQTGEDITEALRSVLPLTGSLAWRKGALRERGIDPSEWSTEAPAPWRVSIDVVDPGTPESGEEAA